MHEVSATQQVAVVELILDIDVLHADLAERIADVDLGHPVAVCGLAAEPYVGYGHAVGEAVVVGGEQGAVEQYAPPGGELESGLIVLGVGSPGQRTGERQRRREYFVGFHSNGIYDFIGVLS